MYTVDQNFRNQQFHELSYEFWIEIEIFSSFEALPAYSDQWRLMISEQVFQHDFDGNAEKSAQTFGQQCI